MKKIITKIGITLSLLMPALVFAQTMVQPTRTTNLSDLVYLVLYYFRSAVYLIMGLAVVMFVWNVYKYFIAGGDNKDKKAEAGLYVMWSIIGFFVVLSFWGLVYIITNTLKLNDAPPSSMFGTFGSTGGYSQSYYGPNPFSTVNPSGAGSVTNGGAGSVTNNK